MHSFKILQSAILFFLLLLNGSILKGNDNLVPQNQKMKSAEKNLSSSSQNNTQQDTLASASNSETLSIGELDTTGLVPLSLEECIRLAVQHNRILKRYRLSDESARIRLKMAESRFLPSGYLSGGRNENRNDDLGYVITKQSYSSNIGLSRALETGGSASLGINNSMSESSNNTGVVNYYTGLGINLNHPLLRGAGLTVNLIPINRAKTYAYISLLTIKQNLIALITRIESNYWDLILVYEDFGIQKQALSRALQLLEINKSLIEAGRMASQEIVQAESDVATREISVANALNDITNAQIQLQDQLDLDKPIYIRPTTRMTFNPTEVNLQECLDLAYQYRPDWLINQKYLEIEKMNLIVAKNDTRYQLNSNASISSNSTSTVDIGSTFRESFQFKTITWNIGLSFTFPFNKETLRNGYILQKLSHDQQELYLLELYDDIRTDVENAVRTVQYTLNQVKLAQRAKILTERKLQLEEEKMRVGRSSNFQVISYQRDLTNAQNSELRKIAAYLIALGDLQQTMGTTLRKWNIEIEEQSE
ncbi:TolC family protein [candidate division KSB1 bacterium]|nr:TolC family protein [candidate division KSB1 bacterium]